MDFLDTMLISSVLGGLFSLDLLVAFQFMFCRPLVAATLTGFVLGEPTAGFSFGCLMELIWAGALPVGSVVPPDFGLAAVFGAATTVLMRHGNPHLGWEGCVMWALLWSLPLASLGGLVEQAQRRWHLVLVRRAIQKLEGGDEAALGRAVGLSLAISFFRGAIFVAFALAVFVKPMAFLLGRVFDTAHGAFSWMYWLALMLGFVVLLDQFWERRWLRTSSLSFLVSAWLIYVFAFKSATVLGIAALAALAAAAFQERRSRA
jgi:mannose/fructose/N-acetylgalactosamine-specific phosphotransferase system component IIC